MNIRLNNTNISRINEEALEALLDTAEAIKTDLIQSQVIPFDTGTMQNDSTYVDNRRIIKGIAKIITDTAYSRKVYFDPEINVKTTNNPNAKKYWMEDYISGAKKDLPIQYYSKLLKRRLK